MLYIDFAIQNPEKFKAFQKVFEVLHEIRPKNERRSPEEWQGLIPPYARAYIGRYYQDDPAMPWESQWGFEDMVDYLQMNMEVEFDYLEVKDHSARLGFSANAYPYGGMDRLLVFLKAYECIIFEAYNGFEVIEFHWEGDYAYETTEYPKKTKAYKATWKSES